MNKNLETLKTNYERAIIDSRTWNHSKTADNNCRHIVTYVEALEQELINRGPLVSNINRLIKDIRQEIEENKKDLRYALGSMDYGEAFHLQSVNECLNYFMDSLKNIQDN